MSRTEIEEILLRFALVTQKYANALRDCSDDFPTKDHLANLEATKQKFILCFDETSDKISKELK